MYKTTLDRLLCKYHSRVSTSNKTSSGLYVPDRLDKQFMLFEADVCGPDVKNILPGDIVMPNPAVALFVVLNGESYCICREVEVLVWYRPE